MKPLAFVGAGRMASAMVEGLLRTDKIAPGAITVCGGADPTARQLSERTGVKVAEPETVADGADFVILACKPQQLPDLDPGLLAALDGKAVISILAGVPLRKLRTAAPRARLIVRAMPNTPGQIGAGITAYATDPEPNDEDARVTAEVLGALGEVIAVAEPDLDAVTGLSGSGPAYVFEFTAALREAGIAQGLSRRVADRLARATVLGAAKLMHAAPQTTPEEQRDRVTSPGGTTEAGLRVLAARDLRAALKETVAAATRRSRELGA
ncbi:MAG: pyrroline-5-carboxylate reductase [Opitutales bacterium]|nr:pyrroline-5-carboxylate reductase [Opitutales bacterium]